VFYLGLDMQANGYLSTLVEEVSAENFVLMIPRRAAPAWASWSAGPWGCW